MYRLLKSLDTSPSDGVDSEEMSLTIGDISSLFSQHMEAGDRDGVATPEAGDQSGVGTPEAGDQSGVGTPEAGDQSDIATPEAGNHDGLSDSEAGELEGVATPVTDNQDMVLNLKAGDYDGVVTSKALNQNRVAMPKAGPRTFPHGGAVVELEGEESAHVGGGEGLEQGDDPGVGMEGQSVIGSRCRANGGTLVGEVEHVNNSDMSGGDRRQVPVLCQRPRSSEGQKILQAGGTCEDSNGALDAGRQEHLSENIQKNHLDRTVDLHVDNEQPSTSGLGRENFETTVCAWPSNT